jgi:hypothetical protein
MMKWTTRYRDHLIWSFGGTDRTAGIWTTGGRLTTTTYFYTSKYSNHSFEQVNIFGIPIALAFRLGLLSTGLMDIDTNGHTDVLPRWAKRLVLVQITF